ncbi:MAG: SulP family inorganic anion transporter [Planctomycetota bacterium]
MSKSPFTPTRDLVPQLWTVIREGYSLRQLSSDVAAGVVVGVVALPLAIAFGIASGVKPEQGLFTAVVAGFLIAALSGSRVQIGGPTGAWVVIVLGIVQEHGYEGLALATMMAGVLLIVMGLAGLGSVIKFIPYPVNVGFTSGIALVIATIQVKDLLGLEINAPAAHFLAQLRAYSSSLSTANPWAIALGLLTIAIVVLWPRVTRRVPGSLVAIVSTTLLVQFASLPVETIASRFGGVPSTLPAPQLPQISLSLLQELSSPALAIALLAAIESLMSAAVADGMLGTRHRSNMELVAQGVANIASPVFGGIPATGAVARTATNIKQGGRSPIAGITHAVVLLLIIVLFAKWASLIPICCLSGILMVVAYNMSEWRLFVRLFRSPKEDIGVLVTTFALTVFVDLVVALEVGVVLAAILFMHRMASLSQSEFVTSSLRSDAHEALPVAPHQIPDGVEVFEIFGTFFFGAASKFRDALDRAAKPPRVLILRMREVHVIDATGLHALEELIDKNTRYGTRLMVAGLQKQPFQVIERAGLVDRIGREHFHANLREAIAHAERVMAEPGPSVPKPASH